MVKTLSPQALAVIDSYLHFKAGRAVSTVPYFNNKTIRARAALRTFIGKGSADDIREELETILVKNHLDPQALADESLKKLLADANLGIDCSALAYYVLNAESEARNRHALSKHLHYVKAKGLVGAMRAKLRPVENCDVATLADNANSKVVPLSDIQPGDFISMLNDAEETERDHILVVHEVTRDGEATTISYSHAVAYPEDGLYGTGMKQGTIELAPTATSITDGLWTESGSTQNAARIFARARKSRTEIRRLNWF